jgi:hypothetical protein
MTTGFEGHTPPEHEWREVSLDEFYAAVGPLNVHPQIQPPATYPYTELWKTPTGRVMGRTVGQPNGTSRYYLPQEAN